MRKVYSSGCLDSRKYNYVYLLAKLIVTTERTDPLSEEEKSILLKLFEKSEN